MDGMKRQRSDSATAAVSAMMNASLPPIEPPPHVKLRDCDRPFWEGVIRARAREEWTDSDLVVGAQLARCQADMEREQEVLDQEGSVVDNHRGTQVANPRFHVLQQLAQREMALLRALRMGGPIPARDLNSKRGLERDAVRARESVGGETDDAESLLA
jgi:hypothetical protein